jgi:lysophospholipase L1-like esterase
MRMSVALTAGLGGGVLKVLQYPSANALSMPAPETAVRPTLLAVCSLAWLLAAVPVTGADGFQLKDGDRVVLLGSTLIEREQRYGYWETALTIRHPDRNISFRNLGWSGDTVWGEARAGFDTPKDGYRRLVEHALALKAKMLVLGYGTNESFAGPDGLGKFKQQYERLLDELAPAKSQYVLLAPMRLERLPTPLPDPAAANRNLDLYATAIKEIADRRRHRFVDLSAELERLPGRPKGPLTDDGMHLTALGYWQTAFGLERGLGLEPLARRAEAKAATLPYPPPPAESSRPSGNRPPPEIDQVERLRRAIVEKNRLYFHRWRPQNETYLFGFRKHEQGQNAREIPQFDPLVAKAEAEIARLRVPVPSVNELKREDGK